MLFPLSLYIHIPWCEKKCPYCDFNSHMAKTQVNEPAYVAALLADLDQDLADYRTALKNRKLSSIFFGGGTPSLFSADSIDAILKGVAERISFSPSIEITLEANPGSAEANKFIGFRQAGVNRLSIGVQSFNPAHLKALGRVHNSAEAIAAAGYAKNAGFDNFNLDLMFGLPEQSIEQSASDLAKAISLNPTHLSCYQLTIEPNTLFHHSPPITPDDETLWQMQTSLQAVLGEAGYQQYEVSAYAQQGRQCLHNLNYWQFGDYLGIGAGAHGKITLENDQRMRNWKIKHPTSYLKRADQNLVFAGASELVKQKDLAFEFMMNALRLSNGFSLELFEQRTRLDRRTIATYLDKHQSQGLINIHDQDVILTTRGKVMVNSMLQDYLAD
jgi:putative oxygen-independent coproporphyrinogen III oxidase